MTFLSTILNIYEHNNFNYSNYDSTTIVIIITKSKHLESFYLVNYVCDELKPL